MTQHPHVAATQVWMMTGGPMGADSFRGADRDEDYQAESPAPSNQVCVSVPPSCLCLRHREHAFVLQVT